ncbi:lipopolysaccharide biosynthesis protein RfbH [Candidatus Hakubella thermalkaliphila]|uniref:CDP-4-dehydro-6-deoxyglucose reductase, E1 n=3 Tax=Candidatus Hakubella thermalkaliphila TaxID=2754717 RepID=A0A6V8Q2H1_9ACTN|nr:lipopolysaccharide biosynthesis protein RfbH [Candidatus Hakubella thermalkaliphila]MBT9167036.1 GDP-4-keto-6-deoxy-D-mannose-3-dehydratase / pyridoxamine-phosphate transaminase [Bacillota bacterium]GFP29959.1 CDP-4-dehydro-6-deoxyglucose reductase, E1 [Candidatus Hakubella thermalkaliphila]GFP38693.1 CDP-4-dehydro-6-deoxyglucose reductase, E1 [Candidatus Hakubella thermalkaliphila]
MTSGTLIPGQVVVIEVPVRNGSFEREHSALVLRSPDTSGELLAALIFNQDAVYGSDLDAIVIEDSDFEGEGLGRTSVVRAQQTLVIHRSAVKRIVGMLQPRAFSAVIRCRISLDVKLFYEVFHDARRFDPARDRVPYAGRVFDEKEVQAAVDAALDFWLTLGPHGDRFQKTLAEFLGVRSSVLVNSGSSANLVAFAALTSHKLGERRIRPGDEVITVAAGFPTTVNPILQYGCVPVFVDSDTKTGNIEVSYLEEALSERTRAVMLAHTLGNPFDADAVTEFCQRHGLWLIEDNCDALGSLYKGKLTGTFGDLSTQSFYPPHHLTMGEGGAVNIVREAQLKPIVESFRDWGRDCWCDSGKENTCGKRFGWRLGELPEGYDHKYIYSHIGYNLKPLDIQAAIGCEQLAKLPFFVEARRRNWKRLLDRVRPFEEFLELPEATPGSEPSWFGFMVLVRTEAPFTRKDIVEHLENHKIQTRMLFGGNLARQPAYLKAGNGSNRLPFRIVGNLRGADRLMNDAFFLGVYPGLTDVHIDYMIQVLSDFLRKL